MGLISASKMQLGIVYTSDTPASQTPAATSRRWTEESANPPLQQHTPSDRNLLLPASSRYDLLAKQ